MDNAETLHQNDQPLNEFARCHIGIINKLDQLGELPALLEPAARAREIADNSLHFFREAIFEHHLDEERELFPAVLASAKQGTEHDRVQVMIKRLTDEHRALEAIWKQLESGLKKVAKGRSVEMDIPALQTLVRQYRAHAHYEETEFLPLSQEILGRNSNHLAALGMSLHMRHAKLPTAGYV
ncbi:MAG: hemerythrin domain-containing protein [Burkholderiaceae bacterium]